MKPDVRNEVLRFDLGELRCAVPLTHVREVQRAVAVTPLPGAPPIIEGVIDVRGEIVPVVDVGTRLGLPPRPLRAAQSLVLVWTGERQVAVRVDGVHWLEPLEADDVADAFDTMLARLEAQVSEQQRFAANASHELRTPLAISRTLLEVARNDPTHDRRELIDRLLEVNARSIDMTEALLVLSRSDQRSFHREPVDLSLIVEEAAETLLPLAEKHGVAVEMTGGAAETLGSHALLLQMTMNLLHNAIVHNLNEGGRVHVHTATEPEAAVLTVENTGEAISPRLVATLTEPFQRGPGRVRSDHSGVGLGLAIVKSVCRAHDGNLTLAAREGGGIVVTVRLPTIAGLESVR